jgi:putative transposase
LEPRVWEKCSRKPRLRPNSAATAIGLVRCGRICLGKKKINFSQVFAGQAVGIKEVHDDIWLVSFMDYDLGYFDLETRVLEPLENPFGPKVLPMS